MGHSSIYFNRVPVGYRSNRVMRFLTEYDTIRYDNATRYDNYISVRPIADE